MLYLDLETSGFSKKNDVIFEYGHVLTRDGEIIDKMSTLVNWYAVDSVPHAYLDRQLDRIAQSFRVQNRMWRITPALLKAEGMHPATFLPWLYDYLVEIQKQGLMFVMHNGINFDAQFLVNSFAQDLGKQFAFAEDDIFDTSAIEKMSQMPGDQRIFIQASESLYDYFRRICYCKVPTGTKWSLDGACMERRNLAKYVDPSEMHTAGADAMALYGLVEEYRILLDQANREGASLPSPSIGAQPNLPHMPTVSQTPAAKPMPVGIDYRGQRNR